MDYTLEGKVLMCSQCGHIRTRSPRVILRLINRRWVCKCGAEHDVGICLIIGNCLMSKRR